MNERIREFEKLSGLEVYGLGARREYWDRCTEKFTNLVIKECIGIIEKLSPGYDDYRSQIEDAFRRDCIDEIKQHFRIDDAKS
jgi:hypothetical protein